MKVDEKTLMSQLDQDKLKEAQAIIAQIEENHDYSKFDMQFE